MTQSENRSSSQPEQVAQDPQGRLASSQSLEPPPASPAPIRVAWVAGPQTMEDYGRLLQPLAIGLLDELVSLTVICPPASNVDRLPCPPVQVIRHGRPNWWAFWEESGAVRELADQLVKQQIQLVHALDSSAAALAESLAGLAEAPYVVSSYDLGDGRALGRLKSPPAAVLAASASVQKELRRRRIVGEGSVHLLRPGVYQVRRASCFTQPQYSITLVAGGRLADSSACQAVVRAFARVAERKYDCAYFIMGSGRAEEGLRTLADKLGLRADLAFADWQAHWQLEEIFKAADIYVSIAPQKDVDLRCMLAMAAGVPVLAPGAGASDFLIEGKTAVFFRKGDEGDIAARLLGFLEDRAAARSLADSALDYLRQNHTPAKMVAQLAQIYRGIAD